MPNVTCPNCGKTHYGRKGALFYRCYDCGWQWPGEQALPGRPYPKDKFKGKPENLKPAGGRPLNGKGHRTTALPPDVPRKKPGPKPKTTSDEEQEPPKKKRWWDIEI